MDVDKDTKQLIEDRRALLKSGIARKYAVFDSCYPERQKESDMIIVKKKVEEYERYLDRIEKMVKGLKSDIPHITDLTLICACYLILGRTINTCRAVFELARLGKNQEVMELLRSIEESDNLVVLFCLDERSDHLSSWFEGKIIEHSNFRELMNSQMLKQKVTLPFDTQNFDFKKTMTDVYRAMSKYTHGSYAAILDSVDVFKEDFDFEHYAGFHYMAENVDAIKRALGNMVVALKALYIRLGKHEEYAIARQFYSDQFEIHIGAGASGISGLGE